MSTIGEYKKRADDANAALRDVSRKHSATLERISSFRLGLAGIMKRAYPAHVKGVESAMGASIADLPDSVLLGYLEAFASMGKDGRKTQESDYVEIKKALIDSGFYIEDDATVPELATAIRSGFAAASYTAQRLRKQARTHDKKSGYEAIKRDMAWADETKDDEVAEEAVENLTQKSDDEKAAERNEENRKRQEQSKKKGGPKTAAGQQTIPTAAPKKSSKPAPKAEEPKQEEPVKDEAPVEEKTEQEPGQHQSGQNQQGQGGSKNSNRNKRRRRNKNRNKKPAHNTKPIVDNSTPVETTTDQPPAAEEPAKPEIKEPEVPEPEITDMEESKLTALLTQPEPAYMRDVVSILGDAEKAAAWEKSQRDKDQFKFIRPQGKYRQRGSLIIPTEAHRGKLSGYNQSHWGRALTKKYPAGRTYDLSIVFSKLAGKQIAAIGFMRNTVEITYTGAGGGTKALVVGLQKGPDPWSEVESAVEDVLGVSRVGEIMVVTCPTKSEKDVAEILTSAMNEKDWKLTASLDVQELSSWIDDQGRGATSIPL